LQEEKECLLHIQNNRENIQQLMHNVSQITHKNVDIVDNFVDLSTKTTRYPRGF